MNVNRNSTILCHFCAKCLHNCGSFFLDSYRKCDACVVQVSCVLVASMYTHVIYAITLICTLAGTTNPRLHKAQTQFYSPKNVQWCWPWRWGQPCYQEHPRTLCHWQYQHCSQGLSHLLHPASPGRNSKVITMLVGWSYLHLMRGE